MPLSNLKHKDEHERVFISFYDSITGKLLRSTGLENKTESENETTFLHDKVINSENEIVYVLKSFYATDSSIGIYVKDNKIIRISYNDYPKLYKLIRNVNTNTFECTPPMEYMPFRDYFAKKEDIKSSNVSVKFDFFHKTTVDVDGAV